MNRLHASAFVLTLLLPSTGAPAPAFEIGITTPLDRVFVERSGSFRGSRTRQATIELARNEYESVQVVIFPNSDIRNFHAAAADFRSVGGGPDLPKTDLSVRLVGSVELVQPRFASSPSGWYPDPLLPNDQVELRAGKPLAYLFTVHASTETRAGDFVGTLRFRGRTKTGRSLADSVVIRVHVWNFTLPRTPRLKSAALCSWDLPSSMWPGVRLTEAEATDAMLRVADLGYRNRLPPSACLANGLASWDWKGEGDTKSAFPTHDGAVFNSKRTGEMIDFMIAHGANHFFIALTANPFALPAKAPTREANLRRYLADYRTYLKSRGLLGMAYVYGIDEPWGPAVDDAKRVFRVVKEVAPEIAFMQNTNQNSDRIVGTLLGSFDALDVNLGWFDTTRVEEHRRRSPEALRDLWWNINAWPDRHPNLFLEYPLADARIIGPMSFKFGIQGFEYWGLFSGGGMDSYHPVVRGETRVAWHVGRGSLDGTLVYPGATGREIYSSLRFESLRDGFEDAEYLYLLAAKSPGDPLLKVDIVRSLSNFATSPDSILAFRRRVAHALERP